MNNFFRSLFIFSLLLILALLTAAYSYAETSSKPGTNAKPGVEGGGAGAGGTVTPDLFTGTMSYSIPIEVPAGRKGMQPKLALTYRSTNGNGWVGVGWDLEIGAIERSARKGIDYSGDDFVLRMNGSAVDLITINTGSTEFRAKIEGGFYRIKKLGTGSDISWEVTDKSGTRFLYGQTSDTRQDKPGDTGKIFKWCLDHVEDTNGNYLTFSYSKDQGQIYPDRIEYAGNGALSPSNYVKFYLEDRTDKPDMYNTNFRVETAKRLKTIEVRANKDSTNDLVRAYKLEYDADPNTAGSQYSINTSRSLLHSVQQFGRDATIDGENGDVSGTTVLPLVDVLYTQTSNTFHSLGAATSTPLIGSGIQTYVGDFDGDGRMDLLRALNGNNDLLLSTGTGFEVIHNVTNISLTGSGIATYVGDFDGDGKADLVRAMSGSNKLLLSTGSGFQVINTTGYSLTGSGIKTYVGDFNGDGKADLLRTLNGDNTLLLSTGNGFQAINYVTDYSLIGSGIQTLVGDFNGDGKTDVLRVLNGNNALLLSAGTAFQSINYVTDYTLTGGLLVGDFNGDGKADLLRVLTDENTLFLSSGSAFQVINYVTDYSLMGSGIQIFTGDFNGDGKTDILRGLNGDNTLLLSTGNAFMQINYVTGYNLVGSNIQTFVSDFTGEGKADILRALDGDNALLSSDDVGDLAYIVNNGLGGSFTIQYETSTHYQNILLPFPVHTVSSITTDDGNNVVSLSTYSYSGGYYHIGEKDFRGFSYVEVAGPEGGPGGVQTIAKTWFHQGNDTAVDANNPNVETGYMKGKPYRTKITDGNGNLYAETTISYAADNSAPYFNPPEDINASICDGDGTCGRQTRTVYDYDDYGNVTYEYQYGDTADTADDRTVSRSYSPNLTNWILNKPTNEFIYSVITGTIVSSTDYYYDYATVRDSAPVKGNLTRVVRILNFVTNTGPDANMTYDPYGNLSTTQDARGYTSNIDYDPSYTFPTLVTNPIGTGMTVVHQTRTKYYGVDDETGDGIGSGLYGQVKSVVDSNLLETRMTYDALGRKLQTIAPDDTSTTLYYSPLGIIDTQHIGADNAQQVRVTTSAGISTWTFFDGLGRTIREEKTGPDDKRIVTDTKYNNTGTVSQTSLPYFKGSEATARWTNYNYDPMGRVNRIDNTYDDPPTHVHSCTNEGVTVLIDASGHAKRETRNVQRKLVKVEEFEGVGTFSECSDVGSPSATTEYKYDVMGNLTFVIDAELNETRIDYDKLGRKVSMCDPDMGCWSYGYDANGNMTSQTDAKGQTISFFYDALNRVIRKHYPSGPDVVYTYDTSSDPNMYPIGRLSILSNSTGTTEYYYDNMGRPKKTITIVEGTSYPVNFDYTSGRLTGVRYPDNSLINYSYNGPNLQSVYEGSVIYANYSSYNAFGQPGSITYGNGVTTTYSYWDTNNRLKDIITAATGTLPYLNLSYSYFENGNISQIKDNLDDARTQAFWYDGINRLRGRETSLEVLGYFYDQLGSFISKETITYDYTDTACATGPHAVKATSDGRTYCYDDNGNMESDSQRTIDYDYDNKPTLISFGSNTTSFAYDGAGSRVEKITSSGITIYIGKLYEDRGAGDTSKYIFAGDVRIAVKAGSDVSYFHQDHLNSSRIITDGAGNKIEEIQYKPFGETIIDTGSVSLSRKYTSQEFDPETGLYFYNARYYNPSLGRFISADTIVPGPFNPQNLNRYSYVINNPLRYVDPSGHSIHIRENIERFLGHQLVGNVNRAAKNPVNGFLMNGLDPLLGHQMLSQTEKGRNYIASELVVATAVATIASFYCEGCLGAVVGAASEVAIVALEASTLQTALMGALMSELSAGYGAYRNDADFLNAVAIGGVVGFISGYLGASAANETGYPVNSLAWKVEEGAVDKATSNALYAKINNNDGGQILEKAAKGFVFGGIGGAGFYSLSWGYQKSGLSSVLTVENARKLMDEAGDDISYWMNSTSTTANSLDFLRTDANYFNIAY